MSESNSLSGQISFCRQGDSLFRFSVAKAARIDTAAPLALLELAPGKFAISLRSSLYESEAYKKALQALGSGAERDFRVVEGV